jgi:hypothetical protein
MGKNNAKPYTVSESFIANSLKVMCNWKKEMLTGCTDWTEEWK